MGNEQWESSVRECVAGFSDRDYQIRVWELAAEPGVVDDLRESYYCLIYSLNLEEFAGIVGSDRPALSQELRALGLCLIQFRDWYIREYDDENLSDVSALYRPQWAAVVEQAKRTLSKF